MSDPPPSVRYMSTATDKARDRTRPRPQGENTTFDEGPLWAHEVLCTLPASTTYADPIWVATDGSVRGTFTGYGWLASTSEYGMAGFRHSQRLIGSNTVMISELRAIGAAVQHLRNRRLTVISDSQAAIAMLTRWMAGYDDLPCGYTTMRAGGQTAGLVRVQQLIHARRNAITPVWVKGHRGDPLNSGAHALARLSSRYASGALNIGEIEYRRHAADLARHFVAEFARTTAAHR